MISFYLSSTDTGHYDIVQPGNVSPERYVPELIQKPPYFYEVDVLDMYTSSKAEIKLKNSVDAMRRSCKLAANILDKCSTILKVKGVKFSEIDTK